MCSIGKFSKSNDVRYLTRRYLIRSTRSTCLPRYLPIFGEGNTFLNGPFTGNSFSFLNCKYVYYKILPMTGFKIRTSGLKATVMPPEPQSLPKWRTILTISCVLFLKIFWFMQMKTKQFSSAVTSLAQLDARNVLVGVDNGDVYQIDVLTFDATLLSSCHTGKINALAFPRWWLVHFT